MEERVAGLRDVLEVELVAEVRGVLGEHAVPEEAEDGRVLLLQPELGLGLELVELVEVGHPRRILDFASKPPAGPAAGDDQAGIELGERLQDERPLVEPRMRDGQPGSSRLVAVQEQVEVDRPRPEARPLAGPPERALDREQGVEERARARASVSRAAAPLRKRGWSR